MTYTLSCVLSGSNKSCRAAVSWCCVSDRLGAGPPMSTSQKLVALTRQVLHGDGFSDGGNLCVRVTSLSSSSHLVALPCIGLLRECCAWSPMTCSRSPRKHFFCFS